jgi:energy-coupling factor transporter ATP-binding protein EcfA2
MSLLRVEGLQKSFGGVKAVQGVSLTVAAGELLALIGPNGAGKSTCFNMLNGQLRPDAGRVTLAGQDITGLAPRPGARDIVHHLIVSSVGPDDIPAIEARDAEDDAPGFACDGGLGGVAVDPSAPGATVGAAPPAEAATPSSQLGTRGVPPPAPP